MIAITPPESSAAMPDARPEAQDRSLRADFEAGALERLSHADHVRVAWVLLAEHPAAEAGARMSAGLQRFAAAAGVPEKFDAALTEVWMQRVLQAGRGLGPHTFEGLRAARPDLFESEPSRP